MRTTARVRSCGRTGFLHRGREGLSSAEPQVLSGIGAVGFDSGVADQTRAPHGAADVAGSEGEEVTRDILLRGEQV